jgi:hypothetical protein
MRRVVPLEVIQWRRRELLASASRSARSIEVLGGLQVQPAPGCDSKTEN